MLLPSGNPLHKVVLPWQPISPPTKRFDELCPSGRCTEGLDAFIFFFQHDKRPVAIQREMPGKVCTEGRHIGGLWFLALSASLRTMVIMFFFVY